MGTFDFLGYLAFAVAAAQAVALFSTTQSAAWWCNRWLFSSLLIVSLLLLQRDAIRANFQIWNPDESQLIAGAMVLQERPVFWRDVDGTTHGPLAQYPLLLPALIGARLDYTSARLVGAALVILLLVVTHLSLAAQAGDAAARMLVLPGWAWFTFNQDPEIAQYSTEFAPSLLLAVAAWPALRFLTTGDWRPADCLLCGLAAGAAPFAKLQAAPQALWIIGFVLLTQFISGSTGRPMRILALVGGALTPGLALALHATVGGAFEDFWIRYISVNLFGYVAEGPAWFNDAPPRPDMVFGFSQFLWPVLGAIVAGGIWIAKHPGALPGRVPWFTVGLAAATAAAIYLPRKPFGHYFILSVGPLLLLLGTVASPGLAWLRAQSPSRSTTAVVTLLVLGLCGPVAWHRSQHPHYFRAILPTRPPLPRELITSLQRHTLPGDELAVWGWQPGLYVFTQTRSATRDLIVFWQIVPSPWREHYRSRYLRDFTARRPVAFVDTTGPADFFFFNREREARHDNFIALRDMIARDYVLAETVAGARIYVRRDRAVLDLPNS